MPATCPSDALTRAAVDNSSLSLRGRLLVVGRHLVVKEYQRLWTSVAEQFPHLKIACLCPTAYREQVYTRAEPLNADLLPLYHAPVCFGRSGRQHMHFYRRSIDWVFERHQPDFVYCVEESNSLAMAQIARVCGRRQTPFVFWTSLNTPRIFRRMYGRMNIRRYLFHHAQQYVFARAAGANATSEAAREVLRIQGFTGPIVCKPTHGVCDSFYAAGQRRFAGGAAREKLRIGFIGRLVDWKAVDVLIRAFALMRHRKRAEMVICGEGPCSAAWRQLARDEDVTADIQWLPPAPYGQMPSLMESLDVLVLPSMTRGGINEKFGRVLIESMAAGAAVIAARDGGMPEAIAGGGELFEPGNAAELAALLDCYCEDAERLEQMQRLGRAVAQRQYAFGVVGRNLVCEMQRVLGWFR